MKSTAPIVALLLGAACSASLPARAADDAIHTSKTRFRIPYRHDAAELQRLGAKEIRLYASVDRGARWQHVQSVSPAAGRFEFQAPTDGEYWFAVRTLDARNQLHPQEDVIEPGLKVVVDTTLPVLDLTVRALGPGKVQLGWRADDPHLDPASLRIDYLQGGSDDWQQVSIVPVPSGQTAWSVVAGGVVSVRGVVSDLARNTAQAQAQTTILPAGRQAPKPRVPDLRQPIATEEPLDRTAQVDPRFGTLEPRGTLPEGPTISPGAPSRLAADSPQSRPEVTRRRYPVPEESEPQEPGAVVPDPTGYGPEEPIARSAPAAAPDPQAGPDPYAAQEPGPRPANGRMRLVNSLRFAVGYKLEDVGPSGVGSVDFYITQDEGRQWYRYGSDEDRQSPFEIEVPDDGTYGFALRVRSGVGLATDPPQPGDAPEIVVRVDRTAPELHFLPVQQGRGPSSNKLVVRWSMRDAHPAEKSIAVYYASDREGPWEPVSGWIADRGQYEWTVGPGVPTKLFLRVAARDEAGNVTRVETDQPVTIDLTRPTARIVDVESLDRSRGPQ